MIDIRTTTNKLISISQVLLYNFSISDRLKKFQPPVKVDKTPAKYYPQQHPQKIDSPDTRILSHDKPIHFIQHRYETPIDIYRESNYGLGEIVQPPNPKVLELALLGAPNAGKSSLMNKLIDSKISAVSNKANTTYESILGIRTNFTNQTQLLIYDTPGIIKQSKHSRHYISKAWEVLQDVQKALFIIDGVKTLDDKVREALRRLNKLPYNEQSSQKIEQLGELDQDDPMYEIKLKAILEKDHGKEITTYPKALVINKMDLCTNKKKLNWLVSEIEDLSKFDAKFFISCETGYGIPQLIEYLESEALPAKWKRHPEVKSDLSIIEIIEQVMKSAIFSRFFEELPYQIGITLTEYAKRSDGTVKLHFQLDVDSIPQKKIVTGHQGRNVKELISLVNVELTKIFQKSFDITVEIKQRKQTLDHENHKIDEVTPDNYGEIQAERIIESSKRRREQMAHELQHILSYPIN